MVSWALFVAELASRRLLVPRRVRLRDSDGAPTLLSGQYKRHTCHFFVCVWTLHLFGFRLRGIGSIFMGQDYPSHAETSLSDGRSLWAENLSSR